MFVFVCTRAYAMCTRVWAGVHVRSETDIDWLPQSLATLVFETESLSEPGGPGFFYTNWLMNSKDLLVSVPLVIALALATTPSFLLNEY